MRPPTSLLPVLTLALTTTLTTAAATPQEPHPPILCPSPATPPPATWPRYAFTLHYPLNYAFVTTQPAAAAQLCQAGGSVVDYAVGHTNTADPGGNTNTADPGAAGSSSSSSSFTWGIEAVADEVADALGYVAATLVVRAPAGLLAELNEQVGNATSRLYGNPDGLARQVAAQIDDAFEVVLIENL